MKYLFLSLTRIKDDFYNQPFLMSLYVIGTTLSVMIFSIFWCNVPELIQKYQEISDAQKIYSIQFEKPYNVRSAELDFLYAYGIRSITVLSSDNEKHTISDNSDTLSDVKIITVFMNGILSDNVNSKLVNELSDYIDENDYSANIVTPYSDMVSRDEVNTIVRKITEISIIYIVCLIGCACLFKYIFDMNTYENIIYAMVGASKKKVMLTAILESVILTFCCSLVAVLLNLLLKNNLLQNSFDYNIAYGFGDYSFIIISTLLLSFIIMLPFFIKYLREPIIKVKREL